VTRRLIFIKSLYLIVETGQIVFCCSARLKFSGDKSIATRTSHRVKKLDKACRLRVGMFKHKEQAVKQDDGLHDRGEQGAQLIETVQLSSVGSCVLFQIALDGIIREEVDGQAHLSKGSMHIVEEAGGFGGNAADLKVLEGELRRCVQEDDLHSADNVLSIFRHLFIGKQCFSGKHCFP
jgi:hypothetical protein